MIGVTGRSDADYYLKAACSEATGRDPAAYYSEAAAHGEPEGVWITRGENVLSLEGAVDPDEFRTLINDLRDPHTGEALGARPYRYASTAERLAKVAAEHPDATPEELAKLNMRAQKSSRTAQHAFDIGFAVPKSVSVLHAGLEREGRQEEADQVWEAIMEGVNTTLDVAARDLAYTRDQKAAGPELLGRSTTRYVHNDNWVMAAFRHHSSREGDPQLHVHVPLLNRVQDTETGRWKTIHSPALMKNKHMMDAVFSRVTEAEVTRRTGHVFATRPDGKAREVVGVDPAVREFFSTRSRAITAGTQRLIEEYTERQGHPPTAALRSKMAQHVTLATREAKPEVPPTRAEELARFDAELSAQVSGGLAHVVAQADAARADRAKRAGVDGRLVIEQAVADLDDTKSTWTRGNLYHAIGNRLPARLDHMENHEIVALMDDLTDRAAEGRDVVSLMPPAMTDLPPELRDENGRSVFDAPGVDRFTTRANLMREDSLLARLDQVGGRTLDTERAEALLADKGLGEGQHGAAMGILTSPQRVHLVNAAAGTGKSRLMGAVNAANRDAYGNGMVGLTTAQHAAQVLQEEGVERGFNVTKFLEVNRRIADGRASRAEEEAYTVQPGTPVTFDEASTISTRDFYEVMGVLDRQGAGKVIIVGDTAQVNAVDNAGAFSMMVDARDAYELDTVRRFTNDWEKEASAQVRAGQADALHQYDIRGRIKEGTPAEMREAASRGFVADTLNGRESVIVTSSGEEADQLASSAQARLVEAGRVSPVGVPLARSMWAGVGDRVQSRRNDWHMTDQTSGEEFAIINREVWSVDVTHPDGSMTVSHDGSPARHLPVDYVERHVDLAYASTVHAVQGRTVDSGHLLVDPNMGRSALYPGWTRGREANTAYVHTKDDETGLGRLVDVVETDDRSPAARTAIRDEQDRAENLGHLGPMWSMMVTEDRAAHHREVLQDVLGDRAAPVLEDRASGGLFRLMKEAEFQGRDPRVALEAATRGWSPDGAKTPAGALYSRVDQELDRQPASGPKHWAESYLARTPAGDDPKLVAARDIARQMDSRSATLGAKALEERPPWTAQLGEPPTDPAEQYDWVGRAGQIASYREQYGLDDDKDAIGPPPGRAEPERAWAWNRAAEAKGMDAEARDLAGQTRGALANRVEQWEREQSWEPVNADDRLRTAHLAQQEARQLAAEAAGDPKAMERVERAQARVDRLETIATARAAWVDATRDTHVQARVAQAELDRRGPEPVEEKDEQRDPDREEARDPDQEDAREPEPVDQEGRDAPPDEPERVDEPVDEVDEGGNHSEVDAEWVDQAEPDRVAEPEPDERSDPNLGPEPDEQKDTDEPEQVADAEPEPVQEKDPEPEPVVDDSAEQAVEAREQAQQDKAEQREQAEAERGQEQQAQQEKAQEASAQKDAEQQAAAQEREQAQQQAAEQKADASQEREQEKETAAAHREQDRQDERDQAAQDKEQERDAAAQEKADDDRDQADFFKAQSAMSELASRDSKDNDSHEERSAPEPVEDSAPEPSVDAEMDMAGD